MKVFNIIFIVVNVLVFAELMYVRFAKDGEWKDLAQKCVPDLVDCVNYLEICTTALDSAIKTCDGNTQQTSNVSR